MRLLNANEFVSIFPKFSNRCDWEILSVTNALYDNHQIQPQIIKNLQKKIGENRFKQFFPFKINS